MRAIALIGYGGEDAVRVMDVARPALGPGEVRVRLTAAAVNPADWKLREGWLRPVFEPPLPYVLGFDGAGVVIEVGDGVTDLAPGQRVAVKTAVGRGGRGAMAEETVVQANLAAPLPDAVDDLAAAASPTAGITAWEALFQAGRLRAGQTVLVNGASGGVGGFVVPLARAAGARVAATAGPDNLQYVTTLGAELAIDYRQGDIARALRSRFPNGVDLVIDTVGQGALADPLDLISDGGALVTINTLIASEARPDPAAAARRGVRIVTATSSRAREGAQLRTLIAALAEGRLPRPWIETLPAREAARAIERVKQGHVRGKLALSLGPGDWA